MPAQDEVDVVEVRPFDVEGVPLPAPPLTPAEVAALPFLHRMFHKTGSALTYGISIDIHAAVDDDSTVSAIHSNAEKFDPKTESVFKYIQVFTAVCDSFAHGANDVANAVGPYMGLYAIYLSGEVNKKSDSSEDSGLWILAMGGAGIGLGLILFGYKIMRAIGVKLAVITPSRGSTIELGAVLVIVVGSYFGLPLSTTHCQVGATTGVALFEGRKGVNKWVLLKTVIGWVLTLVIVGVTTGLLTAYGTWSPLAVYPRDVDLDYRCPAWAVDNEYVDNSTSRR